MHSKTESKLWTYPTDNKGYEVLWVQLGAYHPSAHVYNSSNLLDYIEACIEELHTEFCPTNIVFASDLYQRSDQSLTEQTGLVRTAQHPTQGSNIPDWIIILQPIHSKVRVVTSTVKSDHKAVVSYTGISQKRPTKTPISCAYRKITSTQHALLFQVTSVNFAVCDASSSPSSLNTQAEFDKLYFTVMQLLNKFYPQRGITLTSRDPEYITPAIRAKLRLKNKLMRKEKVKKK